MKTPSPDYPSPGEHQRRSPFPDFLMDERLNPMLRAFREMRDGVMVCDHQGQIRWVNEPLKSMLELPEAAIQRFISGELGLGDFPVTDLNETVQQVLDTGESLSSEFKLRFSRGHSHIKKTFHIHVMLLDFEDPTGDDPGSRVGQNKVQSCCIGIFRDITPIKITEKMRRDFVANVSHELRTPLSVIKGYTETLLDGALNDPDLSKDFLEIVFKHAHRLSRLVDDLLDLSRLESQDYRPELSAVRLQSIAERVVTEFTQQADNKAQTVIMEIPEDLPMVLAHGPSLEQVLTNLFDNAVKYTPHAGNVTVSARADGTGEEDMILVSVQDSGIGIEAKHIPRLFERFYRVDKARSRDMGGTGLGLSIVKHIIQTHGGGIWVESIPNQGTTFYFTLKKATQADQIIPSFDIPHDDVPLALEEMA